LPSEILTLVYLISPPCLLEKSSTKASLHCRSSYYSARTSERQCCRRKESGVRLDDKLFFPWGGGACASLCCHLGVKGQNAKGGYAAFGVYEEFGNTVEASAPVQAGQA